MRYQLIDCSDSDWIFISVDKELTKQKEEKFSFGDEYQTGLLANQNFLRDLFKIQGIIEVRLRRHDLLVKKGSVFQWDEIALQALEVLRCHIAPEETLVEADKTKSVKSIGKSDQSKPPT